MGAEKAAPRSLSIPSSRDTLARASNARRATLAAASDATKARFIPSYDMIPPIGLSEGRELATRPRAGEGTLPQAGLFLAELTRPCGKPLLRIKSYTL